MSGGPRSGGSSKSSSSAATTTSTSTSSTSLSLRCSSVVVTTSSGLGSHHRNGHGQKSESLPPSQCELSVSKAAGIRVGHRWTIRHEEWDYRAFRSREYGWGGRYDLEGEGGDGDGGEDQDDRGSGSGSGSDRGDHLLVFQTRPGAASPSKRFECRLSSSGASSSASSAASPSTGSRSSQQQQRRQQQQQQVARFVRTLVRMHEKWRAKHPGRAQRLVSVEAGIRGGGGTSGSARSGSGSGIGARSGSAAKGGRRGSGTTPSSSSTASSSSSRVHRERREQLRQMSAQARSRDRGRAAAAALTTRTAGNAATATQAQGGDEDGSGSGSAGGRIAQLVAAARRIHVGAAGCGAGSGSSGSGSGSSRSRKRKKASCNHDDEVAEEDDDRTEQGTNNANSTDGTEQPTPMDLVGLVDTADDGHDGNEVVGGKSEKVVGKAKTTTKGGKGRSQSKSKSKSKSKPDHLRVDATTSEAEAEALLLQTAAETETSGSGATSTTAAAAGDSKGGNGESSNKAKSKAKTVTPTPTALTASRKEQQTQQQASQQQRQQPGILHFFGGGGGSGGGSGSGKSSARAGAATAEKKKMDEEEAAGTTATTAVANADAAMDTDADGNRSDDSSTRKVDDTNGGGSNENHCSGVEGGGGNNDERNPKMDTTADGESNSDGSSDDVMDVTDHQPKSKRKPKSKFNFLGSPSRTHSSTNAVPPSGGTATAKLNRRRNGSCDRNRPSASSQARGGIDHGLVRARSPPNSNGGHGGGIGPPSKKKRQTKTATTASSLSVSVNEDPFTFDDGKPTPTSYLPATDLTSRLMGGSSTPNRTYGRNRSSSASPSKRSPGSQRLFPSKSPRNATPLSRIGPTSIFDRPVGGRHLGGKELLAQQKRAEEEEPISDDDEYQRAGDQSDDDAATVAIDDDRSWDANGEASIPSTPPTVRRTGHNRESIMPGRLPQSRRGGRSQDDYGSPVRRRDTPVAHSRRSPQTWGSALRATANKSTDIVREAPYDNFGNSPDTMGAVRKLDDRFGRCESPVKEDNDDGLYDTDDEKSRKKMKRLANNPYRSPGSRIHNRDRLENEQQSRYFNDQQMSTADSALLPRGPMSGGLGRGRRHHGHSMRARPGRYGGGTPRQRARRGQDGYSDRVAWDRIESDRKSPAVDFFSKRGRHGFDRAAERAKENVCTGLRNLGNTCYLNSSLQTLFSVPGFATDLLSTRDLIIAKYDSHHGDESKAKLPLTNALIDTAVDIGVLSSEEPLGQQAGEGAAEGDSTPSSYNQNLFANPKELKKVIDALTDWFHGYQQQDAHEAIGFIVDALHDELAGAAKEVKGKSDSADEASGAKDVDIVLPTDKYFRLEFREQNVCVDCGFTSGEITSVLRNLPIAISEDENKPWTVQETLERHFAPETRELKCEKCPCKKARHTTRVMKKPGALLLSFKRFVQEMPNPVVDHQDKPVDNANGGSTDDMSPLEAPPPAASAAPPAAAAYVAPTIIRSKVRVCLQEKVSLEPFMLKDDESGDSTSKSHSFDAVGVIHHIGSTPHSGHYTADAVRNRDIGLFDDSRLGEGEKKWVTFDDTVTSFTDKIIVLEEETSQRNIYMAMYVAE